MTLKNINNKLSITNHRSAQDHTPWFVCIAIGWSPDS